MQFAARAGNRNRIASFVRIALRRIHLFFKTVLHQKYNVERVRVMTRVRLILMHFCQFFIWGAWLITFGAYAIKTLHFSGAEVGAIYGTLGLAAIFMPVVLGIIADQWVNAERVYGCCHLVGAGMLLLAANVTDPNMMFWLMLLNSMAYIPTIALANTVSYQILEREGFQLITAFPPIRVWGTIGFIVAMWLVSLCGLELSSAQLWIAAVASAFLGIYSFTLPACKPAGAKPNATWTTRLGLDAFVLFKQPKIAIFMIFSMLLGVALQITNMFGDAFIHDFALRPEYVNTLAVRYPAVLISLSQMSETLFILTIPFMLRRFGIKAVMVMSMIAWVLRFGLFAFGNPTDGLWLLVLSMIFYGCAFDFFNISGSLFVDTEVSGNIRASAQGLFAIMTNGFGCYLGAVGSGWVVDHFTTNGIRDWHSIWLAFALYSLVVAVLFVPLFRYKHVPPTDNGLREKKSA